jgi:hypothetical protein
MSLTQEQANAIAEQAFPSRNAEGWTTYATHLLLQRQAYAKALMSMNPLIEAGEKMKDELRANDEGNGSSHKGRSDMRSWDTALSNLTKSIEP